MEGNLAWSGQEVVNWWSLWAIPCPCCEVEGSGPVTFSLAMRAAFRYSLTDRTGFVINVCFLTQGLSSETGFGSGLQFVRATLCDVELSGRPIVLGFLVSAVGSTSLSVSLLTDTAEPNTCFSELSSGIHDFSAVSFDFSCDRFLLSIFFRLYF